MTDFRNKVVLITGGALGIGRATALAFAREGAKVVVVDLLVEEGEAVATQIRQAGGEALFVRCDVSDTGEVEAMVAKTVAAFGRLDCACNNAGIEGELAATAECSEENWDRTLAIDLKGVWLCMKAEIRQMLSQGRAGSGAGAAGGYAIVNLASIAGLVAERGLPAYAAAKGGVISLTRTTAAEYARLGIRVNAVCPGVIRTPMIQRMAKKMDITAMYPEFGAQPVGRSIARFLSRQSWFTPIVSRFMAPMGRAGEPEEIAATILWLCSSGSTFITGHALVADGGTVAQ